MITFDFEYLTDYNGYVTIETDVSVTHPDPYALDSDIDYYGSFYVENYRVYKNRELVDIEIIENDLLTLIRDKIRKLDMEQCFQEE